MVETQALGQKVRRLRLARDWSQKELAAALGVHQTKVSFMENGTHQVTIPLAQKLAVIFDMTLEELVDVDTPLEQETA